MKKLNKQKGITLIALIITIIVMLILVGVTINVALNGGLFEKAKDAKEKTEAATEKEQLLNAVFATLDDNGKIHLDNIELPDGFKESESSDNVFIGPSGKEYEVSKTTGAITDKKEVDLAKYYLLYLQVMYGIIDISEIPQEEVEIAEKVVTEAFEQRLIHTFDNEYNRTPEVKLMYYMVDGYAYKVILDDCTITHINKDSEEYQKVKSLKEEWKSIETELKTLLIESDVTFTGTEDIKNYLKTNLSGNRDVNNNSYTLEITSSVDNDFVFRYKMDRTTSLVPFGISSIISIDHLVQPS